MTQEIAEATVTAGGATLTLAYRPGTRDEATVRDIFEKHPYRLGRFAVAQRTFIDDAYQAIAAAGRTPLILDLGANIGASPAFFARLYPAARIVAVEPEAANFALLTRNAAPWPNIVAVEGAVAAQDGELSLFDPGRSTDAYRATRSDDVAHGQAIGTVRGYSVASLTAAFGADAEPLLAKIDIEGAEAELFAGDTGWVDDFPAIAIELHDWMLPGRANSASFLKCVAERGRDFVNIPGNEVIFSLRNGRPSAS